MNVIVIFPDKVADILAIQATKDEVNEKFEHEISIFKENDPDIVCDEYMDIYRRQYDYFFEILTNEALPSTIVDKSKDIKDMSEEDLLALKSLNKQDYTTIQDRLIDLYIEDFIKTSDLHIGDKVLFKPYSNAIEATYKISDFECLGKGVVYPILLKFNSKGKLGKREYTAYNIKGITKIPKKTYSIVEKK